MTWDCMDKTSQSLLSDTEPFLYISMQYAASDLNILTKLGLAWLNIADVNNHMAPDLRGTHSRIKTSQDMDWQQRITTLLLRPFEKGWTAVQATISALPLIPLSNGRWVSGVSGTYYFPTIAEDEIGIPTGLGFNVVDKSPLSFPRREELFERIGVLEVSATKVAQAIFDQHLTDDYLAACPPYLPSTISNDHYRYLYLARDYCEGDFGDHSMDLALGNLWLAVEGTTQLYRLVQKGIYMRDEDAYGPAELSCHRPPGDCLG
jgi:hypothetical protein